MKIIKIFSVAILCVGVFAQRKQRAKNQFGIEPDNIEQLKQELVVEKVIDEEEEENQEVWEKLPNENGVEYSSVNGVKISGDDNWQPWNYEFNKKFELPNSKRVVNKERVKVESGSKWEWRLDKGFAFTLGKLPKFYRATQLKAYLDDAVLKIDLPSGPKRHSLGLTVGAGAYERQLMVHVNSTYVKDAIYDKLYAIRSNKLSKDKFKQMIAELYNDTYAETLEQLKKDYSMMSYPLRKFLERDATRNLLMNFVKDHQDFWWSWFDQDPIMTLFFDGDFFRYNNVTMDPQGVLMKEFYWDQVFEIGASDYINEQGYITKSWLWYRLQTIEAPYLEAVDEEILLGYLKQEIPSRTKAKMYELAKKGPALFSMF